MDSLIKKAVEVLKAGGTVVYPTDTAYGLAVDATNSKAVEKLYRLKGRDFNKPVHVIMPAKDFHTVQYGSLAKKLIKKYWPGPLTIVLPLKAKGASWQKLSAGTKTLGIRYPDNKIAQSLVESLNKPITTTSANISGKLVCYSIGEVKKQFEKSKIKPDFYINGGKLPKVLPSTIVSLVEGVKIIRGGPISEKEIKRVLK